MATINYTEFLEAQRAYDEAQCAAVGGTDFGSGAIYSANTQFFLVVMGCVVIRESRALPFLFFVCFFWLGSG